MTESLLLYMNLRSKQIVRVFAGIGPFRCLFLIGIAAILFYAFAKVTSVWVLPVCYLLMLWLYHNSRKDKEFLSLQVHGIKRLFTAEYLLLGLPFIISGIIAANYISLPVIILIAVVMPWIHPVRFHSIAMPMPLLYSGDLLYRRMFRKQVSLYAVLLFLAFVGELIGVASASKNGLMQKTNVPQSISLSDSLGVSILIAEVLGYSNFDIIFNHSYRKGSYYRLIIGSERDVMKANKIVVGNIDQCDFYYSKEQSGNWGIYAKNKIGNAMMLTVNNFSTFNTALEMKMVYKEIPSDAVKIEV